MTWYFCLTFLFSLFTSTSLSDLSSFPHSPYFPFCFQRVSVLLFFNPYIHPILRKETNPVFLLLSHNLFLLSYIFSSIYVVRLEALQNPRKQRNVHLYLLSTESFLYLIEWLLLLLLKYSVLFYKMHFLMF